MTSTDFDPTPTLRAQLIARLTRQGALTSPAWAAAFASVPRHFFVSRFDVPTSDGLLEFASPTRASGSLRLPALTPTPH